MGLRGQRAPGRRRDPRGRARLVALAAALYLGAGVLVTWPGVAHLGSSFAAAGQPGYGGPSPGDHLQAVYNLWLPGDQLVHGRAPWRDAYQFQPEAPERVNVAAWPLAIPFWPLEAALGPVLAWNLLGLLLYVVAGGVTALWLRELDLPPGAAIAGGLVFAVAPYRTSQSVEHLLGPISILLPGALLAFERRRHVLAAAALASIPLSGQVHLALGAIPFFAAYALVRRDRSALAWTGGAVVAAAAAGLLVQRATIDGSIAAGGRSLAAVSSWSADWLDLLWREPRGNAEQFAYVGWLTPVAASAGLVLLVQTGRRGLAAVLGAGALVPVVLALGTNTPLYEPLWHALPPFRYPRVPERLLPIACLCLAALVAVAVGRIRRRFAPAAAVALLALDLATFLYEPSAADPGNRAYAVLPPGRILELPVFRPEIHYGSVYQYYALQVARERPGGYSTVADPVADRTARRLQPLSCGDWSGGRTELVWRLGVRAVLVHRGLFLANPYVGNTWRFAEWQLARHGFRPAARDGDVTLWVPGHARATPPPRSVPVPCVAPPTAATARWEYRDGWRLRGAVTYPLPAAPPAP